MLQNIVEKKHQKLDKMGTNDVPLNTKSVHGIPYLGSLAWSANWFQQIIIISRPSY